jgi:transcriptional regulator with XRE-family HTH domain
VLGYRLVRWSNRIRDLRQRQGWTQQDLADRLGTDAVTVSRWERGVSQPRPSAQRRLRVLTDIPAELTTLIDSLGEPRAARILKRALLLQRGPRGRAHFQGDPDEIVRRTFELARQQRTMKERTHVR